MTKKTKRSFIGVLVAGIMCLMVCIFSAGTVSATAASAPAFTKAFGTITATTTESGTNIVATSTSGSRVDSVSTYQFGQFEMKFKVASASSLIDFYFTDGTNIKGFVRLFLNDDCLNFTIYKYPATKKGAVNQFAGGKDNMDYEATIAYDMATKTFSFGDGAKFVVDEQFLPTSGKILVGPAAAANLTIKSMQGGKIRSGPVIQFEDEFKTIYVANEDVAFDGITIKDNSGNASVVTMIVRDEAGNETVVENNKFKFDNEGTYTLIIKASDGNLETTKEVMITVKKNKNSNSGCGSVAGSIGAFAVLGLVATAFVLRSKKEEA